MQLKSFHVPGQYVPVYFCLSVKWILLINGYQHTHTHTHHFLVKNIRFSQYKKFRLFRLSVRWHKSFKCFGVFLTVTDTQCRTITPASKKQNKWLCRPHLPSKQKQQLCCSPDTITKNSNSTSLIIIKTHFNENQINQNKHMWK